MGPPPPPFELSVGVEVGGDPEAVVVVADIVRDHNVERVLGGRKLVAELRRKRQVQD